MKTSTDQDIFNTFLSVLDKLVFSFQEFGVEEFIQASRRYIESLPLVLKDKRSCFSQGETSTVQLPLD